MTMPSERARAINYAREFLRDLLDPKKTPRVPREIRVRAYRVLRHYPWSLYVEQLAKKCPDILEVEKEEK
jgi:hypothetical protein